MRYKNITITLISLTAILVASPAVRARRIDAARHAAPFPKPTAGYVTDDAHLLSANLSVQIDERLKKIEQQTGVEICVVTIGAMGDYPGTPNQNIEQFATALFERWGVGNRPRNDGVLLLVSVRDGKARIELGGGYQHSRDADSAAIMKDVIVPRFRRGDYAGGIDRGVDAIAQRFAGQDAAAALNPVAVAVGFGIVGAVGVATIISLCRYGYRGWGWVFVGLGIVVLLALIFPLRKFFRLLFDNVGTSSDLWWNDGGSSWSDGGGFGGGFGGGGDCGGGSSGGGGATGSW